MGPRASCVLKHYMSNTDETHFLSRTGAISTAPTNTTLNDINNNNSQKASIQSPRATVDLLPWDLRMRSQKDIRTEGLFAALNDCLYRSMYRYL